MNEWKKKQRFVESNVDQLNFILLSAYVIYIFIQTNTLYLITDYLYAKVQIFHLTTTLCGICLNETSSLVQSSLMQFNTIRLFTQLLALFAGSFVISHQRLNLFSVSSFAACI